MRAIREEEYWIKQYDAIELQYNDLQGWYEFFEAKEVSEQELDEHYKAFLQTLEDLEMRSTLREPEDALNCILKIKAGAGGTESCDWSAMLLRMYTMWAKKNGYEVRELHRQDGDVAGIETASIEITGDYTYGLLKGENGVHRLVRPSPFNAQGKRQTSFASVFVYPLVDDRIEIQVNPADLDWDTFRASGAGGQHVNRTESAVRVTHRPSGIIVECQQERSQHQNRDKAIQMLKSALYQLEIERRNALRDKIESTKSKIEWGSQIRSYVLDDRRIKDHRSGYQTHDVDKVLDGNIDDFLKANLLQINASTVTANTDDED